MATVLGLLTLAAAGGAQPANQPHEVTYQTVTRDVEVPSGTREKPATESVKLKCPPGFVVALASYNYLGAGWDLRSRIQRREEIRTAETYFMRFENFDLPRTVTVKLLCRSSSVTPAKDADGRRHDHQLSKPVIKSSSVSLGPDARVDKRIPCPKGTIATLGAVDAMGDVQVEAAIKEATGREGRHWLFTLKNNEVERVQARLQVLCARTQTDAAQITGSGGHTHSLRTRVVQRTQAVGGTETGTVAVTCPNGFVANGGGYVIEGHTNWILGGSRFSGASWSMTLANNVSAPLEVTVAAVCIGKKTT